MKKIIIVPAMVGFMLLFFLTPACKKENNSSANNLRWFDFKKLYYDTLQPLSGNASGAFSVTGAKGTKVDFPANAFVDFNTGAPVTGNVTIQLMELTAKKNLLFKGQMKFNLTQEWIEAGETSVYASQNGNAIKVNPAIPGNITVTLPSSTGAGSGLNGFYRDNMLNWIMGGAATGSSTYSFNIQNLLNLGMLGDYSCAKVDALPRIAGITVTPVYESGYDPDPATNDQVTFVAVFYKDAPEVVQLNANASPPVYKNKNFSGNVSFGRQATIVAYSGGPIPGFNNQSTYLYAGSTVVTLQSGATYNINLNKISQSSLDAILATL
jgi:hypothetical protein